MMLKIYTALIDRAEPILNRLLEKRLKRGKEDAARVDERRGQYTRARPDGRLIWLHAASVGEAQSALIIIHEILAQLPDASILVTTGTLSSAKRMEDALPERAFHQFIPLDHPQWVARFLDHWQPNCALWMESELWPNMLLAMKKRDIPAALINARLSPTSLSRWALIKNSINAVLSCFDIILAQSEKDMENFQSLGAHNVVSCGNLKYSAAPLPFDRESFDGLRVAVGQRPIVVYASTHAGEEVIAADVHGILAAQFPDLLSIIIPRHPERGEAVAQETGGMLRGADKALPDHDTAIYIANTLGEMGLFYRLSPIVYVGRSLSADGGGGHNPLEPALLNCVVLHGKNVQNLQDIYDDMQAQNACIRVEDVNALAQKIEWILNDPTERDAFIQRSHDFANAQSHVIDDVMKHIMPILQKADHDAA